VKRLLAIVILAVGGVALFSALLGDRYSPDTANATLDLVRGEGMARAGYAGEAPLAYADPARRLTGEAPEIARAVFQRMGVLRIQGVLMQPDRLIAGLYARRFELIASGMEIIPERCPKVLFSDPTHALGETLLVRKGNPLGLHSYTDLAKSPGLRLGVVSSSPQQKYAVNAGVPAGHIRPLSAPGAGVASLVSGVIDAFASDALTIQMLADQADGESVERALPFTGPVIDGHELKHYGAFAFRNGDKGLAREFNAFLRKFIGTPEHLALVRRFGITAADLPGPNVTAKAICRYGHPGPPRQIAAMN
jgi:polar amino acid transport system substrate-binding protein